MKKPLQAIVGLIIATSSLVLLASRIRADEIEWILVPGTRVNSVELGSYEELIGENTIVRSGDAINFDYLFTAHFGYARLSGNCSTGWLIAISEGFYDADGNIVINSKTQRDFEAPEALDFACSQ